MVLVTIFWAILAASCAYVASVGGRAEKICMGSYAIASVVSAFIVSPMPLRFRSVEWPMLAVDLLLLLVFLTFVVRSKAYWPLWTTAFQVVTLIAHTSVLGAVSRRAYAMSLAIFAYAIIGTIIVGAYSHRRAAPGLPGE